MRPTRRQPKLKTTIRVAEEDDLDLLWDFLALAAYEAGAAAATTVPVVASHLFGWKRPGDFGFVATLDGKPVGAAWARQFRSDETVFYLDDRTPELSIAVREKARGQAPGQFVEPGIEQPPTAVPTLKIGASGVHNDDADAAGYGSGNGCVHAPSRRGVDG